MIEVSVIDNKKQVGLYKSICCSLSRQASQLEHWSACWPFGQM